MTDLPKDLTHAKLELLLRASAVLGRSLDFAATMAALGPLIVPELADGYVVDLVEDDGSVHRVAALDENPAKAQVVERLKNIGAPNASAPMGIQKLLESGRTMVTGEITREGLEAGARNPEHLAIMLELEPRSGMIVPLRARGRSIGIIWIYASRSGRKYTPEDARFIEEIAARAALAIDNARLFREAQSAVRARDDFLAIASHELRTPIAALLLRVQGFSRQLERDPAHAPTREDIERFLLPTTQQIHRLSRLVDELLDVSNLSTEPMELTPTSVDLGALLRDTVSSLAAEAARRGSPITLHIEDGIEGSWDRARVSQIVMALVSNAVKYGDGRPLDVKLSRDGDVAVLEVVDRGIGIAAGDVGHIFERFERRVSSRHFGGFGLGLWIVKRIVDASGGTITAESTVGAGSTFVVRLPIRQAL